MIRSRIAFRLRKLPQGTGNAGPVLNLISAERTCYPRMVSLRTDGSNVAFIRCKVLTYSGHGGTEGLHETPPQQFRFCAVRICTSRDIHCEQEEE